MENAGNEKRKHPKTNHPHYIYKRCAQCGEWFPVMFKFALYKRFCSIDCRLIYNRAKLKTCPHCGKVIPKGTRGGARVRRDPDYENRN